MFDKFSIALLNNIPLIRAAVVTVALSCISYLIGMAAIHSIDYSFLSIALVGEILLDIFGRNKSESG